jgi:hypothetical protein
MSFFGMISRPALDEPLKLVTSNLLGVAPSHHGFRGLCLAPQ